MKARRGNAIIIDNDDNKLITDYLLLKLQNIKELSKITNGRLFFTDETSPEKERALTAKLDFIFKHQQFTEVLAETLNKWPNTLSPMAIEQIRQKWLDYFLGDLTLKTYNSLSIQGKQQKFSSFKNHFETAFIFALIAKQSSHFITDSTLKLKLNILKKITLFNQSSHKALEELNTQFYQALNEKLLFCFISHNKKKLASELQQIIEESRRVETHQFIDHEGLKLWEHLFGLSIYLNLQQSKEFPFLQIDTHCLHIDATQLKFDLKQTETILDGLANAIYLYIHKNINIKTDVYNIHPNEARILLELLAYIVPEKKSNNKHLIQAQNKLNIVITKVAQKERKEKLTPEFKVTFSNRLFVIKQRSLSDPQLVSPRISPKNQS